MPIVDLSRNMVAQRLVQSFIVVKLKVLAKPVLGLTPDGNRSDKPPHILLIATNVPQICYLSRFWGTLWAEVAETMIMAV